MLKNLGLALLNCTLVYATYHVALTGDPAEPYHRELFQALLATTSAVAILTALRWVVVRITKARCVYALGYRHGRLDSNKSLMEAGIWVSNADLDDVGAEPED